MIQYNPMLGHNDQLASARRIMFREGMSEGVKAIELRNPTGLFVTLIEDQCLNPFDFSYRGTNCAFQTKNGLVSNRFFNGGADEFCYYWPAGMMSTCGLANVGEPATDNGVFHPQHGRISMMPAENVSIEETEDEFIIRGTAHDRLLCGHHLMLERSVIFPKEGKEIRILDTVTNCEALPAEMMILYHCNVGYPLLAPGARMVKGTGTISNNLGNGLHPEDCGKITEAKDAKEEEVYCHTNTPDHEGFGSAAVMNDELGLGWYVKYRMDTLPLLMQWKNFCTHDYVMGLEPSNSYILGRTEERKNGTLPVLAGYESKTFEVVIGILDGKEEMSAFETKLK